MLLWKALSGWVPRAETEPLNEMDRFSTAGLLGLLAALELALGVHTGIRSEEWYGEE